MRKIVAAILSLLILSMVSLAQNPPPATETSTIKETPAPTSAPLLPVATGEEAKPSLDTGKAAIATDPAPQPQPKPEPKLEPQLQPQLSPAETSPSYRLAVNFAENSLELMPLSAVALDSMSVLFAKHKRNRYEVHGYSCPTVSGQKTVRFGVQRVERMVEHLVSLGIPGENILTVVNAPKSTTGAAAKNCTDDRRVDIISSGMRWRIEEMSVANKPPEPTPDIATADSLRAEMQAMKQKLAAAMERPEPPQVTPTPPAPEPLASTPITAEPGSKQIVAVYMAGVEPPNAKGVHTIVGGELARVLSESEKYTAVDRTEAILEQLNREHIYQRSGAVDDEEIKALGHQLGVGYLCISNINAVGKRYYLDTRLVDVVTAEITRSVTATSNLRDANEMTKVGRNIALELLEAEKTLKQRKLRKKIFRYTAIGLDILGAGAFAYGYLENGNVVKHTRVTESISSADGASLGQIVDGPEAGRAATRRNAAYVVGGALLTSGVTIHIVF